MWVYHRIPSMYHITRPPFLETQAHDETELFQLCIICFHCVFTKQAVP